MNVTSIDPRLLPELATKPKVLKTRDLAEVLDLCPDSVSDMARKGIIHGYKKGHQWRFRRKDVEAWIRARLAAPESQN